MSEVDQTTMMLALQKELIEMKNEEEIKNLRKENQEIKKLVEGGPSLVPMNQVGRSFATAAGPQTEREPRKKTSPWRWMVSPTPTRR